MKTERFLALTVVVLLGLAPVAVAPAEAGGQAKGVPDAPPVEKILARHDGFVFPKGFETRDGRQLPQGIYDLLLIESGNRYYVQLINQETRKGIRVIAEADGEVVREMTNPTATVSLRSERGRERFEFQVGNFTASVALRELRRTG